MSTGEIHGGGSDVSIILGEEGDDYVDVTDSVKEYEKGKTFSCGCGQGFGVDFEVSMVQCPSCGKAVVDLEWEDRSAPEREQEQQAITDWV